MKKLLALSIVSLSIVGCVPLAYDVDTYTPTNSVYYYDDNYDYYDGAYGNYVGGVYYVYMSNGSRYRAPPPRYSKPPRFSQKGWDGFRPGDRFPQHVRPHPSYPDRPNYYPNRPNVRPDVDRPRPPQNYPSRPSYNSDKPDLRPDVKPWDNRPDLRPDRPNNSNVGNGRPVQANPSSRPQAKPQSATIHESRSSPSNNNSRRDDDDNERPSRR